MEERPSTTTGGSRKHQPRQQRQQQHGTPAAAQVLDDPAALKQQIYSQLKRSGVVSSLKVSNATTPVAMIILPWLLSASGLSHAMFGLQQSLHCILQHTAPAASATWHCMPC